MTSFWDLGILAAGPVGGLVAENLGFRAAFWAAAAMSLASLAVTSVLPRRPPVEPGGMKQTDHPERSGVIGWAHLVASPPGDLGGKLRACGNVQLGEDVREVCLDCPV